MSEAGLGLVGEISRAKARGSTHEHLWVDFRLGHALAREEHIFVELSPEQRMAISQFQRADPVVAVGRIRVKILHNLRTIQPDTFYPLGVGNAKELEKAGVPLRQGIGSQVLGQLAEHLAKLYPSYLVQHPAGDISPESETQLRKMGIDPRATYLVEEYRDRIKEALEKNEGKKKKS